jgi:hypothetical protein
MNRDRMKKRDSRRRGPIFMNNYQGRSVKRLR